MSSSHLSALLLAPTACLAASLQTAWLFVNAVATALHSKKEVSCAMAIPRGTDGTSVSPH